jgi:hypothetical protein
MATRTPRPLTSPLDAIEVFLTLLDREPTTTLAALLDRLPGATQALLPVAGGDPGPAGAPRLAELLAHALPCHPSGDGFPRLVLVSVRDHGGEVPAEADLAAWRALVGRSQPWPLELLDWFVLTDEAILSLAELAGPPARWDG